MRPEQTLFNSVVEKALKGGAVRYIAEQEAKNLVDEYRKYGFQYTGGASKAVEKFAKEAIKRSKAVGPDDKSKAIK